MVLDRTAFYVESGGQPCDTGTLGGRRVTAVLERDGEVLHVLDAPLDADRVRGSIDPARRLDHTQQHHGQHLLSRAFVETARAETIAFHLGAGLTTIDLDRPVTADQARTAQARANEIVWQARPVRISTLPVDEAREQGIAPPEGVDGEIRVVEAEGYDRQPCGGTHPKSTAGVGVIVVVGLEKYKAGSRVSFVCGQRALEAVSRRQRVLDELAGVLSAPLDGLVEAARKAKADLVESDRRRGALLARALEGDARRLVVEARAERSTATSGPLVVTRAFDGWPAADLRLLAQRLVALEPCVALLGSRAEKAHLVFAQSDGLPHDIPGLLRQALELLGGRGGGRGNLVQGGGERSDLLDEALARATRTLAS